MLFNSRYAYDDDERDALRAEAAEDADRGPDFDADREREADKPFDMVEAALKPWLRGYRAVTRTEVL